MYDRLTTMNTTPITKRLGRRAAAPARVLLAVSTVLPIFACASGPELGTSFESPESAFDAMIAAVRADDMEAAAALLGPDGDDVFGSGDPISDRADRDDFLALFDEAHEIEMTEEGAVLLVGADAWPAPIPVVEADGGWRFDAEAGRQEIRHRRIGRNELATIQACLAFVDAQHEYAAVDRDGDGLLEYARTIRSTPGRRDGLYWETSEGESPSPLGALVAEASAAGRVDADPEGEHEPRPYNGYHFRVLESQGPAARGGAYDYVARDSMIGGCALVAYPARYGVTGVMTFLVNHDGVVFESDLGDDTESRAAAISSFDPAGWSQVAEEDVLR